MPKVNDPDEKVPALNVPALFANDFYVVADPATSRVIVGEKVGTAPTNYHTVLVMPTADARSLAQLILELSDEWFPEAEAKKHGTATK
jgi:hypothetical protein